MKPAYLRPQAEAGLVSTAAHYADKAGFDVGERMLEAALAALAPIERMPKMGSLRLGEPSEISGPRSWSVTGFPLRWLYFETDKSPDVIRLSEIGRTSSRS